MHVNNCENGGGNVTTPKPPLGNGYDGGPDPYVPGMDFTVTPDGWTLGNVVPINYEFGTLTIQPGGFIRALSTELNIKAKTLVVFDKTNWPDSGFGPPPTEDIYHIIILGADGSEGEHGVDRIYGEHGVPGVDGYCPCILGGGIQGQPTNGTNGGKGITGGNGGVGNPGHPNMPATLCFGDIPQATLAIITRPGSGGNGGKGGKGSIGGKGGAGGNSTYCGWSCMRIAGNGGHGGQGGGGGMGGDGGKGADGVDINVYVAKGQYSKVNGHAEIPASGQGGGGGLGGDAGPGGDAGKGICHFLWHKAPDGRPGSPGSVGTDGPSGNTPISDSKPAAITVTELDDPLNPPAQSTVNRRI
jgi:hypothetical protein